MSNQNKRIGIGCVFMLFVCGICAVVFVLAPEDKEGTYAISICARINSAYNQPCESKDLLSAYHDAILACMPDEFYQTHDHIDLAILCLESEGVDLIREITP